MMSSSTFRITHFITQTYILYSRLLGFQSMIRKFFSLQFHRFSQSVSTELQILTSATSSRVIICDANLQKNWICDL